MRSMFYKSAHTSRFYRPGLLTLALATLIATPASAMAQTGSVPNFSAAGNWTVGATQVTGARGIDNVKIPCVMANEFDNGFVVRLTGGDQKMLAMAIDFRQDVFAKGRKYPAMITLGEGYVQQAEATAFSPSTLIFNLRNLPDFYVQMAQQNEMGLSIESNNFKFSMGNLSASLATLESCYNGVQPGAAEPVVSAANMQQNDAGPAQSSAPSDFPQNFDDIVQSSGIPAAPMDAPIAPVNTGVYPRPQGDQPTTLSRLDGRVSKSMDTEYQEPAPIRKAAPVYADITPEPSAAIFDDAPYAAPTAPTPPPMEWQAFAGEDVQAVLKRWSDQAGYDLQWQAKNNARVTQNLRLGGDFKNAVDQLLAQNVQPSALDARVENAGAY